MPPRLVDYFRHPNIPSEKVCEECGLTMHDHGYWDKLDLKVCPGDYIAEQPGFGEDRKFLIKKNEFESKYRVIPDRRFPRAMPRKWRNKDHPTKILKVLPWFQPLEATHDFDYMGLFIECFPEDADETLAKQEVFSGMVLQVGYQLQQPGNVWICAPMSLADSFEDLGEWPHDEEPEDLGIGKKKKKKAKKRGKARRP